VERGGVKQEKQRTGKMKKIPKHNSGSQPNALIDVHFICMETGIRYDTWRHHC